MPLSVFYNQNKRTCTNKLSHITRFYRVRGFNFGGCGEYFQMPPLMGLNKLNEFCYKMESKTMQ